MGVVKALLENECMPSIVTGTSGGAIVAAMLATRTDEEMLSEVIQPDIAVRYPERWFPPMEQQLFNYVRSGCLVEHDDFANCCRVYFGDMTFGEAYARTGRVANINIPPLLLLSQWTDLARWTGDHGWLCWHWHA